MIKLGLITIGQSPRVDAHKDLEEVFGNKIKIVECGALDNLSEREIEDIQPGPGDYVLVSRLRDGQEVRMARKKVIPLVQNCIYKLEQEVDLNLLFCTGEFPEFHFSKPFFEPSYIIRNVVRSVIRSGNIGVFIPNENQLDEAKKRWGGKDYNVKVFPISPYKEKDKLPQILENIDFNGLSILIFDCVGYTKEMEFVLRRYTDLPIILPRTLVTSLIVNLYF